MIGENRFKPLDQAGLVITPVLDSCMVTMQFGTQLEIPRSKNHAICMALDEILWMQGLLSIGFTYCSIENVAHASVYMYSTLGTSEAFCF